MIALTLAIALAAAAPADPSLQPPALKPGLWTSTLAAERGRPLTLIMCVAEGRRSAVFEPWTDFGGAACTGRSVTRTPAGGWSFSASCLRPGGAVAAAKAELSGDLQTSFTYATDDTVSGAPKARDNGELRSVTTGAYQGACPADMPPGQAMMQLPNGSTVQIRQAR